MNRYALRNSDSAKGWWISELRFQAHQFSHFTDTVCNKLVANIIQQFFHLKKFLMQIVNDPTIQLSNKNEGMLCCAVRCDQNTNSLSTQFLVSFWFWFWFWTQVKTRQNLNHIRVIAYARSSRVGTIWKQKFSVQNCDKAIVLFDLILTWSHIVQWWKAIHYRVFDNSENMHNLNQNSCNEAVKSIEGILRYCAITLNFFWWSILHFIVYHFDSKIRMNAAHPMMQDT